MPGPEDSLYHAARNYAGMVHNRRVFRLKLWLDNGEVVMLPVPDVLPIKKEELQHSVDYRWVRWGDVEFTFSPLQAAIIGVLLEARQRGVHEMGQDMILEESGSESRKIGDLFKDHAAWGTLLVPGSTRGAYRLALAGERGQAG